MSELINNPKKRKELLKHMILQLHSGEAPDLVRNRLAELLRSIPYNEVVEVEQELISEGLPAEEVLKFCDIHHQVMEGHIDQGNAKTAPEGHPVHTFKMENLEIQKVLDRLEALFEAVKLPGETDMKQWVNSVRSQFNNLMDIEKHYLRKEYLLFPFLEKHGITGPPKVMWGKHDETRELLKASIEALSGSYDITPDEAASVTDLVLRRAAEAVSGMITKEEEILFPMCMDKLMDEEWYSIFRQTPEFGFCLYDPETEWIPEGIERVETTPPSGNQIHLSTGSFNIDELEALFRRIPVDFTYVDKDDKVKFFSMGPDRIFTRNRAIIGRDVRMCHPPSSVHVVEQILNDFKTGAQDSAAFWINMKGRFIYIEYFALRGGWGEYLGTLEFTQELTELKKLEGEQRLLSYKTKT